MVTLTKTENPKSLCKLEGENMSIYNSVMKMSLELKSLVKNLSAMQETLARFLGQEDPLKKG